MLSFRVIFCDRKYMQQHDPLLEQLAHGGMRDSRIGVIDIGSNSIRLVIYDSMKRVPLPVYNEKAFCTLAKGISKTNRLNPEGVKMARQAIARLLATARLNKVAELHIIATAAMREADDGKAFVKELERKHKVKIDIISGKREAKFAALGIASSHYKPHGIVADLGGGSLELTALEQHDIKHHASHPIGSLRLLDRAYGKYDIMEELINTNLDQTDWLADIAGKYDSLYAVGGSFRALARIYMRRNNYPLNLLHDYTLSANSLMPMLQEISQYSKDECSNLPVSSKRQIQLPAAALIMINLINRSQAKQVIFSTSGIREGLLFSLLSPYICNEDPLLASCDILRHNFAGQIRYSRDLFEWMDPLFHNEEESSRRIRIASCMLNHLALNIQQGNRPEWAYHHILHASIRGLKHHERVAISSSLYHRYKTYMKDSFSSYELLDEKWRSWAKLVGAAMRLGYMLSGGSPGNLSQCQLRLEQDRPKLRLSKAMKPLQGDTLEQLKKSLSDAYIEFMRHNI